MYEEFFGLHEKPFSLTPDPRYFYRSAPHANALELVQHGIRRRDGVIVITGTSGTGKTTLCRTLLDGLDRQTFSSLVLNPYISDEDLIRLILRDFGVISRDENRGEALLGPAELMYTLQDFLQSLRPLDARALVIIDEAQKLPLRVLEQIRRLSGLATGPRPLMQIVLVGQLNLAANLRAAELRPLENRVSIRYRLRPLTSIETACYVKHRLKIAGGDSADRFTSKALQRVHRATAGTPRLINLVCDRALVGAFSIGAAQVTPDIVTKAASGVGLEAGGNAAAAVLSWMRRRVAAL
jgi:general secretion pathway protein A